MTEKAPTLSFQCPKLWQNLSGSEKSRFCEACGHDVQNLSLMTRSEREALLQRAKTERVCGTYSQDLEGNLVTARSSRELALKLRTIQIAAATSGGLALASCADKTTGPQPVRPPGSSQKQVVGYLCPPEEEKSSPIYRTGPGKNAQSGGPLETLMNQKPEPTSE